MASTKLTFGAVLNTVTTTASALTSTISALGKGADMLSAYADKQAMEQAYLYSQEVIVFKEQTDAELALRLATSAEEVNKQKAKSSAFATSFDHYFEVLKANRK